MPRCRVYYHVVVATKGRQPHLTPRLRQEMTEFLRQKAFAMQCVVHAIHCQPGHMHLALSIPPTQPVATVIGQLKGSSSYAINQLTPRHEPFGWQLGYGLFTCSERRLGESCQLHRATRRLSRPAHDDSCLRALRRGRAVVTSHLVAVSTSLDK